MNLQRQKIHKLIEELADDELHKVWNAVHTIHCDFYMLKAITAVKQSPQPGDTLTQQEAVELLDCC